MELMMTVNQVRDGVTKSLRLPEGKMRIASPTTAQKIVFAPRSYYNPLIDRGETPVFIGMQTCEPDYQIGPHWHPYTECLVVLEGEAFAWLIGKEDEGGVARAGDVIEFPPILPHAFRTHGNQQLRLLGIHCSPTRIVHFLDESLVLKNGYQVLNEELQPTYA
ncbi:cupin domain-containing protein [Xanthobacter sp. KR7-225]|uniref:cupin domain-containing protein n=1 Tax=Xanthobacter sp. KR7-225 TaxID=3156613 RepID=UPI0032B33300